ncbi:MAG: XylR N-terminal domain-containing protein [Bacillota bacterium]|nr:XylR N-terminal domain-containing protein [Bacillota bacterium]
MIKISTSNDLGTYKVNVHCTNLSASEEVENKQGYDIDFLSNEGTINLLGTRRIMFPADAFGHLRKELIFSLGEEIARQIIFRFGYECGANDAIPIAETIKNRDISILLGPFFHCIEGIVLAKNQLLEFSKDGTLEKMSGSWFNSYEVEQHLKYHGLAREAACWSLTGYASGFASCVFNEELLCIETECAATGSSSSCTYEIRPVSQWPPEVKNRWFFEDYTAHVKKDLSNLLAEERERDFQRRLLQDCFGQLYRQGEEKLLLRKLIYYAHRLVKARYTALFHIGTERQIVLEEYVGNESIFTQRYNSLIKALVDKALHFGDSFIQSETDPQIGVLRFLSVPVTVEKTIANVMVIITDNKINNETIEKLKLLTYFSGTKLEQLHITEELSHLKQKTSAMKKEQDYLQETMDELSIISGKTEEFLDCILQGQGILSIVRKLGEITQTYMVITDESENIIISNLNKERAENLLQRMRKKNNETNNHIYIPLQAAKKKLGDLWAVERHQPLDKKQKAILEKGARIISLELLKEQEAQLQYRFNFFDLLLSGKYTGTEVLITQANKVGFCLDGIYQLIGLSIESFDTKNEMHTSWELLYHHVRTFIKSRTSSSKVLMFDKVLIIFLSFTDKYWEKKEINGLLNQLLKSLKDTFTKQGIYMVAGRICRNNLNHYPVAYREIRSCISIMSNLKQRDRVVDIENLGVLSILFEVEQDKLVDFVNHILGPLVEYDEKYGSELIMTLSKFVKNNFNIQSTARNSFISSSTLKYRLKKIREFMGFDLDDPEVRLSLQLALKLTEY